MLEHQKIVLRGVSDNKELFKKELVKSLRWLSNAEKTHLEVWVNENFSHLHEEIIKEAFYTIHNFVS